MLISEELVSMEVDENNTDYAEPISEELVSMEVKRFPHMFSFYISEELVSMEAGHRHPIQVLSLLENFRRTS